jgi:hypothetical protein
MCLLHESIKNYCSRFRIQYLLLSVKFKIYSRINVINCSHVTVSWFRNVTFSAPFYILEILILLLVLLVSEHYVKNKLCSSAWISYGLDAQQKLITISSGRGNINTHNKGLLPVVGRRNWLGLMDFMLEERGSRNKVTFGKLSIWYKYQRDILHERGQSQPCLLHICVQSQDWFV